MALADNDLAILSARFGVARFGASRFGFVPCPEDVEGLGHDEPGEYIWKEEHPPITEWTLVEEDCVCRNLCTLALGTITLDDPTPLEDVDVTASVTLSGVIGEVDGIARINWGDGRHDESVETPLVDGVLQFTGHYHVSGDYTITIEVTDERGCEASVTLPVTVGVLTPLDATFVIDIDGQGATGGTGVPGVNMTLTPTVTGGSGNYSYAWTVWNENTSEGSPLFTSTDEIPIHTPVPTCCVGQATLTVTDTSTMLTFDVGPNNWDWNCI
jgi:hypothetical protein